MHGMAAKPCPRKLCFGTEADFRPPKVIFGRRKCMTFVSGERVRPPKAPPNLHDFRLWKGPSAAESAAESAMSSLFMSVLYACFYDVLRGFWGVVYELFRVCLAPHWSPLV
ncbi:hypothetical protein MANES_01G218550v8 [Manihot esculenta]|uniref:Uncharacterized protein n=1 Tax=Manihot esculenta TaxID=3983 RepID=A0ACB7IGZ6_MANES|nr:hypothetical protein MANES_01G218550v8 [Manihot esculenta]